MSHKKKSKSKKIQANERRNNGRNKYEEFSKIK
jgi:hypothetical protein